MLATIFFTGVILSYIPCNNKWSLLSDDKIAVFHTRGKYFCSGVQNMTSEKKTKQCCIFFNQTINPDTVFEVNNTKVLVAKSVMTNSTIFYLNGTFKMTKSENFMIRFNIFSQTLYTYSNQTLREYCPYNYLDSVMTNKIPNVLSQRKVDTWTDFQFTGKTNIIYMKENKFFADSDFIGNASCLPLYIKVKNQILISCFFTIIFILIFVFTGHMCIKKKTKNKKQSINLSIDP